MRFQIKSIFYLLLLWSISTGCPVFAQMPAEQYLYIDKSARGNSVNIVNPRTGVIQSQFPIVAPSGLVLVDAYLSPNSQMIALVFANGNNTTVAILNVKTMTMTNVVENILPPPPVLSLTTGSLHKLYWSPDSRYIAYSSYDVLAGAATVSIYDVQALQTILLLTNDVLSDYQYIWSPDSQNLLVVRHGCIAIDDCTTAFDLFSPDSGERTRRYTLAETPEAFDSGICELRWSPDGRYIAYVASCMMSAVSSTREVYVLDFSDNTVHQITNFTINLIPPLLTDPVVVIYADYSLAWYTSNKLLIGVAYGSRLESGAASIIYDVETQQSIQLLDSKGEDWERYAASSSIAYRAVTTEYSTRVSHHLNISTLFGTSLQNTVSHTGIAACNFAWSPDGTLLMYSKHELIEYVDICDFPIEQVEFLDVGTNQVVFSIPVTHQEIIPLGWIQTES